jgi:N-hydroxyarylamine O-acetyltransferase
MDAGSYLHRIGIDGKVAPDLQSLRLLQSKHILHVPFENIDIYYGVPIEFSVEAFYKKIVNRGRGGYCYELNGLFHQLLISLGYDARLISALVTDKISFITEYEHMAIVVEAEGTGWLVDVGYGDSSLMPLKVIPEKIQSDGFNNYRIMDDMIVDGRTRMSLEKYNDKLRTFVPLYYFTLDRRTLNDFMIMHEFQEVAPNAHYKKTLICSIATDDGRISIINDRLIETRNGLKEMRSIGSREERDRLLRRLFNIDLKSENISRAKVDSKRAPRSSTHGAYSTF